MSKSTLRRRLPLLLISAVAVTVTAACSSSTTSSSPSSSATPSSSTSSPAAGPYQIAVLVGGASNAYQAAGVAAIQAAASANNAVVTVFDAAFDANKQYSQFQTAITSGKYQGILVDPVNGPGLVPLAAQAKAAGIKVAAWNQPIGSDLTTPNPTVDGVTNQAMFPVFTNGKVIGDLTKQACAEAKANPCKVADLYYQKGSNFDTGILAGYNSALAGDATIQLVAGGDTGATRAGGLSVAQTVLTGHPDINVMFGTSQAVEGAVGAVASANVGHKVYLIGESLTRQGAAMVASGQLYGGSQAMADQEGKVALQELVKAIAGQPFQAGLDPGVYLNSPCVAGVTKANVSQCTFDFDG